MKALESEPDHSRFYFGPGGEQMKQASDKAHPNEAHKKAWHCRALAVDPSQQGKGYGSALVRHVLAKVR
jgi:GNAT superfamily N-acetyltransferase